MKEEIEKILSHHVITSHSHENLFITDYKDLRHLFKRSDVSISERKINGINSVHLRNENKVEVYFDGFPENALPLEKAGIQNSQCECVLFPKDSREDYWILFIETKYANDLKAAFNEQRNYPHCMVNQIIETVKYFREKGLLKKEKKVNAIVSFPNLIEDFNSTLFTGDLSIEEIIIKHKIKIRGTNSAIIKSDKRLKI